MKFLVDNQLPDALARFLVWKGREAVHVLDVGLATADGQQVWAHATANGMVVVSKDEDFLHLSQRGKPPGQFLWVRLRNCRNAVLVAAFDKALPGHHHRIECG